MYVNTINNQHSHKLCTLDVVYLMYAEYTNILDGSEIDDSVVTYKYFLLNKTMDFQQKKVHIEIKQTKVEYPQNKHM